MENTKPVSKKEKIKTFFSDRKFMLIFLQQFLIIVIIYGSLFNFTLYSLFSLGFSISNILSLGFLAYFIKEEIPDIVRACKK